MEKQNQLITTSKGQIEYVLHQANAESEKTCLLFHGGHSNCFEAFGIEEILAANVSALVPSRAGYGQTSASIGTTAIQTADAMLELIDALSIDKVSVLAISAGGPSALQFAARYPERVDKLVLESAVTMKWLSPSDDLYKTAKRMFHPRIQNLTWTMLKTFLQLTPNLIFKQMIPSFSKLATQEVLDSLSTEDRLSFKNMLLHLSSGSGFLSDIDHTVDTEVLQQIQAPTLIVHSKNDNSVSLEHPQHAQKHIKAAEYFEAQTWGHLIWIGAGSSDAKAKVTDFLKA